MRITTTLAAAAALTISGVAVQAGGPTEPMMDPMVDDAPMEDHGGGSSISSTYVIVGVLAALLIAAAANAN